MTKYRQVYTQGQLEAALAEGITPECVGSGFFDVPESFGSVTVRAHDEVTVTVRGWSIVRAFDHARIFASDSVTVHASDHVTVRANGFTRTTATGECLVAVSGQAIAEVSGGAVVRAYGSAAVNASGRAVVHAFGNSTVEAHGNSAVFAAPEVTVNRHDGRASIIYPAGRATNETE